MSSSSQVKDHIQFRFVPTMRCNLKCDYCFLPHSVGNEPTMFDERSPSDWISALRQFASYDIEFYMWGGEPFCVDGTFRVVEGFAAQDFVKWARIDSNLTFTKQIVSRCPSEKVKILCSWHTHTFDFDQLCRLVGLLDARKMVGMVNFVASDSNMEFLKMNTLQLDDVIRYFADKDIFFNVAADFGKGSDPAYQAFITKYMTPDDWNHIHDKVPCIGVECDAGSALFTVEHNGTITSCARKCRHWFGFGKQEHEIVGDFFRGELSRQKTRCPNSSCRSIVSYCHRSDNSFVSKRHLEDYIARNMRHRQAVGVL
jgi:sulfatase maturation enzyme AslB (radical SAM superfamily)